MAAPRQARKPPPFRRIVKESAIFLTAGLLLSIAVAWGCAAFISIARTPQLVGRIPIAVPEHFSQEMRDLPYRTHGDPFRFFPDHMLARPLDQSDPDFDTEWFRDRLHQALLLMSLEHRQVTRAGAARRSMDLLFGDELLDTRVSMMGPSDVWREHDSRRVDSLHNIARSSSRSYVLRMTTPSVQERTLPSIASVPLRRQWPSPLRSIESKEASALPGHPLTLGDIVAVVEGVPAEEDARGWPFLCLFSRIHEHRDDAIARASRPVSGGIWLPPRQIPLTTNTALLQRAQHRNQFTLREARALPLLPIWPGLILNTLIYAAALWLLTLGPLRLRRALRTRKGHCPHCAYDLNNLNPTRCPECGHATIPQTTDEARSAKAIEPPSTS